MISQPRLLANFAETMEGINASAGDHERAVYWNDVSNFYSQRAAEIERVERLYSGLPDCVSMNERRAL